MGLFLINDNKKYSYEQLLAEANGSNSYFPLFKQSSLFLYFLNLIKALASNSPLILLDADLNTNEIEGIDESSINVSDSLPERLSMTMEEMIDAVQKSNSKITIFTSGTTGQPKKVVHNVQNLTRAVRQGEKYHGQVWAYAYNPTHMAGLQVFFQAFLNQNSLINVFNKSRSDVYELIENQKVTHISATPTFYRLLLPFEKEYSLVQRVTLGGEKSDNKLYENIKKIFPTAKINNVYASTEAGSLFAAKGDAFKLPDHLRDKFKIIDDELLIHKSLLGQSSSFTFEDDYYHSGDLIEWVDEKDGIFRFKSRKNELVNVGGYKVNPQEIEETLLSIDGVQQALVFGKPNSILGNVLCADIVIEQGYKIDEISIKNALKARLQDFKIPRRIKFVDSFSLTRTGKIKR